MISLWIDNQLTLGLIQALIAAALALAMVIIGKRADIRVGKEVIVALSRAMVQIIAVSLVLVAVFTGPLYLAIPILAAMMIAAAIITGRRAEGIPHARIIAFKAVLVGAGSIIISMTLAGVIEWDLRSIIPVGSMIVANAMNTSSLALERFKSEVFGHTGEMDTALALGAETNVVVRPYVHAAVKAAMIPRIDSLRSLGIVWIPGIMSGMVLSGTDPIYAGIYQFVIMAMIFASSTLSALTATLFIRDYVFSEADQLIFRPGTEK